MLHPSADSLVSADEFEYNRVHGCYTVLQRYLSAPYFCSVIELDDNEAAISLCLVHFSSMPEDELLLAVGTVKGLTFYPRHVDGKKAPQWQLWAELSRLRHSHYQESVSRYIQQYVKLCGASYMWPGERSASVLIHAVCCRGLHQTVPLQRQWKTAGVGTPHTHWGHSWGPDWAQGQTPGRSGVHAEGVRGRQEEASEEVRA